MSRTRRIVFGRNPRRTLIRIAILTAVSFITFGWLLTPIRVRGISMEPTYQSGSFNLVNRLSYAVGSPARGDVVAIRLAGPSVVYVKRIVGLPGERVAFVQGVFHVNGVPVNEPYVRFRKPWDVQELTLGPDEYYVVGDNRGMSAGSHSFGGVRRERILGKVLF